ncbi:MAG: SsrA-binding protein SmpB [Candidatus Omnitrophota bacterium]|nr:SsrA-binding protein SmpB [Candidatus Omnitrophota bacterium]MBU1894713.1 SsrA-binding protein SmpB [Candidatus Omnitrophota bacterium]
MKEKKHNTIVTNRQAFRDYHIDKTYEAGLRLQGSEVKSLRAGKANLKGSFARLEKGELFLYNMHINPYEFSQEEYNPLRPRKILLHKTEIKTLEVKSLQQGFTLVPTKVYFKRGYAKVEIALAKGKKLYDKRHALKEKQVKREMDRVLRHKK